jgi:hypothetical protein
MDGVWAKLKQAILYKERNTKLIRSITSFAYIVVVFYHTDDYRTRAVGHRNMAELTNM